MKELPCDKILTNLNDEGVVNLISAIMACAKKDYYNNYRHRKSIKDFLHSYMGSLCLSLVDVSADDIISAWQKDLPSVTYRKYKKE